MDSPLEVSPLPAEIFAGSLVFERFITALVTP